VCGGDSERIGKRKRSIKVMIEKDKDYMILITHLYNDFQIEISSDNNN
jgi:hypothetical protein